MKKFWIVYRNANYGNSDTYFMYFETKLEVEDFILQNRRVKKNEQPDFKLIESIFYGEMMHEEEFL